MLCYDYSFSAHFFYTFLSSLPLSLSLSLSPSLSLPLSLSLSLSLSLVDDTKRLVSSAGGTQEQLAEAATKAVSTIQTGADQVKKGASSLTSDDVEAQVSLPPLPSLSSLLFIIIIIFIFIYLFIYYY